MKCRHSWIAKHENVRFYFGANRSHSQYKCKKCGNIKVVVDRDDGILYAYHRYEGNLTTMYKKIFIPKKEEVIII